jgi:hypothetical protein
MARNKNGGGTFLRAIPWPVWLLALGAAAWFGRKWLLIGATIVAFHPVPVPPIFQGEPRSSQEAQLQDLRHFEHVRRNERSWTDESRAHFDAQVAALQERAGELTDAEFMLGLARAQATIDNGHSNASATAMIRRFPHLPIRTAFFGDELRVVRTNEEHRDLLGMRVTHLGGLDVNEVAHRFRDAFGGTNANYRIMVPLLLETPAYLETVGIPGPDITIGLETDGAAAIDRKLTPIDVAGIDKWTIPGDLPLSWKKDAESLVAPVLPETPLYLQREEQGYWRDDIAEINAVYINLRTNFDDDSGQSLRTFSHEAVEALRARPQSPSAIIVDLRFNHGGDYSLTHELMVSLGDIVGPGGRVYILTSGNTFSAAIVSIAFAKESAPDRTIIVGEEIGDRLQFWAEGWRFDLPNSGFRARYATAYYDLQHGCRGLFKCYWGAFYLFPVIVDDLDVDISAPLTFEAYAAGRDPALEAISAAEQARGNSL